MNDENGHVPGKMDELLMTFARIDFAALTDKERHLVRRAYEIGYAAGREATLERAADRFRALIETE